MKMTDEMKKQIEQLKTENEDLQRTLRAMRQEITALVGEVAEMYRDNKHNLLLRRAVAELQDELRKYHPDVILISTVYAPTRVDGR
jgi:NTP pyrophosphatase (non-canonical NTP hydrolase)